VVTSAQGYVTMQRVRSRHIPLFWRLFVPNALVLGVACVVLIVEPANGRVVALVGGLAVMLVVNLLLMRRTVEPLTRLTALMRRVDPLRPGQRMPELGPRSEVSVLAEAFDEMLDRLEAERRESGRRAQSEREAERRRIAGELHDQIGQTLTAIALQAGRLAEHVPPAQHGEATALRDAVLGTVDEVRELARQLRPEALDMLGLVPALTNLVERLSEQTGVQFVRELDRDLPPLDADTQLVLYRVAQEAVTNAIRHADARSVAIRLEAPNGRVVLTVADDGRGLRGGVGEDGSGIRGMRERALLVGGDLRVGPRAGGGTEVRLEVTP
jgi:two-component system, NarL family, sensor histidine kinase UhpB